MDANPAPLLIAAAGDPCLQGQYPTIVAAVLTDNTQTALPDLPRGILLQCPPCPPIETDEPFDAIQYTTLCKTAFSTQINAADTFYYIQETAHIPALRAAVLAIKSLSTKPIMAQICVQAENRCADHTDCLAAMVTLQRIGVTTLFVTAEDAETLSEALCYLAPEARLDLGACCPVAWLGMGLPLPVWLFLPVRGQTIAQLCAALPAVVREPFALLHHDDLLLVSDGRDVHYVDITADISEEIPCDHRLSERLIAQEDEGDTIFKLVIEEEEDIAQLVTHQYMITRPVCLCAEQPDLLDRALHAFHGVALYDGTWEQEDSALAYFEEKYGLIRL